MEPFKIICVTCQAKLSVCNESLIGKIVACPRCDSMVEVTLPAVTSLPFAPEPVQPAEEVPAAAVTEAASLPALDTETLQVSASVAKYKLIAWSLASFIVGAALVGAVLLTRNNTNNEATALVPKHPAPTPAPITATLPTPEEPVLETLPLVEIPPTIVPETVEPTPTVEESVAAQPVIETVEPPAPTPVVDELPSKEPLVARRFDPLDFDPESLTLATVDQPSSVVESTDFDLPDEPMKVPVAVPSTLPLVRRGPERGEEASGRDAGKQLALLVPRVKMDHLPLVDCLRLFSQLSGVSVSVAPEQLLMAGITPQKNVSLDASEISLGEMLTKVLQPLRLKYTTHGSQVVVTRQEALKHREINYPVDDLVGSDATTEQLADWVRLLVAPTTWKVAGGDGTLATSTGSLRIAQTQQVQYQVLILLERLRLARNLPPKSRYPVKRLAGTPANVLLQEKLAKRTTFTFSQYTAIDDIFVHWQTELGVPLLIDWPALAEVEVWPATTIACAIIEQSWGKALDKVLGPLELDWRATTGGAIEITSAEKVQNELQLELYPLRVDFEGDATSLRTLAKQQDASGGAGGVILYDPVGKVFLVLEPAATQRVIFERLSEQGLLGE